MKEHEISVAQGALSDNELDDVSGGCGKHCSCSKCKRGSAELPLTWSPTYYSAPATQYSWQSGVAYSYYSPAATPAVSYAGYGGYGSYSAGTPAGATYVALADDAF